MIIGSRRVSLTLAGLVIGACSEGTGPEPGLGPSIRIIASPGSSDSVLSTPVQALVAEVRDEAGHLSSGVVVRFTTIQESSAEAVVFVGPAAGTGYSTFSTDTTDTRGRAVARIEFGTIAGPARIAIAVPLYGLADTAEFTVAPGAASSIRILPQDTAVYAASTVQLQANVIDQFNNPRPDAVTFSLFATPAGVGSITTTGRVSATSVGRIGIVAMVPSARDTAFVSVVPRGTIAAFDNGTARLITIGLDGSGYHAVSAQQFSYYAEPAWSPDGTELVVTEPFTTMDILRVSVGGSITPVALPSAPGLGRPAYWPAYSPDGQFIYFSNLNGAGGIWRIRPNGSGAQAVTPIGTHYRPTLSPDGQFVAFHSAESGVVVQVYDVAAQSYLGGTTPGMFPEWSPVSDSVAFIDVNDARLRLMHRSGSGNRYVSGTDHPFYQGQLAWSRDGRWILAGGYDGRFKLVEVATGLVLPLSLRGSYSNPAWRPGS